MVVIVLRVVAMSIALSKFLFAFFMLFLEISDHHHIYTTQAIQQQEAITKLALTYLSLHYPLMSII